MLNKYLDVKPEVAQAIAEGKPVLREQLHSDNIGFCQS